MSAHRLLVITYHFGSNGAVGGLRWTGITKYLVRLGWEVRVITAAPPEHASVESCPRFWTILDACRLLRRLAVRQSLASFPDGSWSAPGTELQGWLGKVRSEVAAFLAFPDESRGWVFRAALRARSVIRRFQPHVVVSSGPPHSAHLVAGMATAGTAARWLIDLRDPWGGPLDEAWASHARIGTGVFRTLSPLLERLAFRASDGVITNAQQLAAVLTERYPDVPVVCVPNGVDPEGLPGRAPRPYAGLSVAYTGTLYAGRDLGPVVQALRLFLARHPEAARAGSKLRIAGRAEVPHAQAFRAAVAAAGMAPHVEVLGALSRPEAMNVLSRSHLAVVLAQEQELQIPAKLYESVAMGIPTLVVAPATSAAAVEGARVGAVVCDPADVERMAGLFEDLWRDGARAWPPCRVPISYDGIAVQVDRLLRDGHAPASAGARVTAGGSLPLTVCEPVIAPLQPIRSSRADSAGTGDRTIDPPCGGRRA